MRGKSWIPMGVLILLLTWAPVSQAVEKVKFVADWILTGPHSFLFIAREKGFYRKAGFDIDINRGRGSGNTIKWVSIRSFDFGFADTGALVAGRSKGAKAKEVAMVYGRAPHMLYFLKGSGIQTPKDLEGHTLGASQGGSSYRIFGALATLAGFNAAKVKFQFMGPPSQLPSLLSGKIDATINYIIDRPVFTAKARKQNKEIEGLLWADFGLNTYSNGIIAHEDDIANKPDRVRRFLKATIEGLAYGVDLPEEAAKLFLRFNPESSPTIALEQWKITVDLLSTPEAKKNGIGYMLHEKVKATRDIIYQGLKLKGDVKVEDLYTNQFNPKMFPKTW